MEPENPIAAMDRSREQFMLLCLLYPAQLAWTASLLRDGPSCFALFAAFLAFSHRQWVPGAFWTVVCLSLRPEFIAVMGMVAVAIHFAYRLKKKRKRLLLLGGICLGMAMLTYIPRDVSSKFGQTAFASNLTMAYPDMTGVFDFRGYLQVLAQAMIDPLPLAAPTAGGLFPLLEVLFFGLVVLLALWFLRKADSMAASLLIALFTAMWMFGYMEIWVGGFSRHRLGMMILLIAIVAVIRTRGKRERMMSNT